MIMHCVYCADITYNMAGTMAQAAGLFMAICVLYGIGSSQLVPDGQVYTEVKKTLVQGFPGVLTCHFFGDPIAVYWEKGHDPDDLDLMLVWYNGEVSGPRYDDRSCDIDENYSLIITNVSTVDAGRIYCTVSNYRGILINNYTDVSVADTAIGTRSEDTLQMGQATYGVLKCTVRIKARKVSWKKGASSPANGTLVVLENDESQAARSGFGYDEGMYNITEDYSLIIKNVQIHHEGLYVCEVTDFDTGISFQSYTFARVIAHPRKPFPTIQECRKTEQNDSQYCTLEVTSEITLTCQVMEYYPEIYLLFLHGSNVVEHADTREWNNIDGTKNKTVKIVARESKKPYTCVASNIPGSEGRVSTSVLLHDEDIFNPVLAIVIACVAALILFSIMAYFIWRRKHRHSDSNYTQDEQVELQHFDDKDVKNPTLEKYQALLERVNDAMLKQYRRIYDLFNTTPTLQADHESIICKNRISVFDTEQMLNDWQQKPESTHRQYMKAVQVAISTEDTSDHAWPSNEELRWISRHLNQESMTKICKKLKITKKSEDNNDEEKRYNSLRKWRNKVAHEHIEKKHNQLSAAIGSKHLRGLLPPLREGQFIYKAELVDMAFNLLMQDLLPLAEALGINATKLISYRPAFQPSHLGIGTIGLLSNLLISIADDRGKVLDRGGMRNFFYSKFGKLAYRNVATFGMLAYDMSYGELYAISEAMACVKEKAGFRQATQSEDGECEKSATSEVPEDGNKEKNDIENPGSETPLLVASRDQKSEAEKAVECTTTMDQRTDEGVVEIPKDLVGLQGVLQLTDQDIADCLGSSHPITAHELFRIWKEKPRRSVFNYRAALAHELREIKFPDLADDVIAGNYIKEQTSLEFIKKMVQGMSQDQLRSLGKLLNVSGKDEHWHTRTPFDVITKQIYEWVTNWTKEMKPRNVVTAGVTGVFESFKEVIPKLTPKSEKHRELNDKLVEQGFLDLAREVMIIEQQIKYV